uniref:AlNc14C98G5952 protein n=1 Tax=Albugo laibachii Nc14 TaxID=890382 RepID=F0WH87_9STRA|nr:AlNc14C98G5952 [Albugo laibachii Nc14]|eukprot:CCA20602.1 AlNc14C98G5952 [Albugo laibachii Nc14]
METRTRSTRKNNCAHHPVHPHFVRRVGGGYVNTQSCVSKSKAIHIRSSSASLEDQSNRREISLLKAEHTKLHDEKETLVRRIEDLEEQQKEWRIKIASLEATQSQLMARISALESERGRNVDNQAEAIETLRGDRCMQKEQIDAIAQNMEPKSARKQIATIFFYCETSTPKNQSPHVDAKASENARIAYLEALVVALKNENNQLAKRRAMEEALSDSEE